MELTKLPHYCGERQPNTDYHHGELPPVKGACCFQVTRANRTHPEWDDGVGGTYKHGADLAYWNGVFYLHYFTNPMSRAYRRRSEYSGLVRGRHALGYVSDCVSAVSDSSMHNNRL